MRIHPVSPIILSALCCVELPTVYAQSPSAVGQAESIRRRQELEQLFKESESQAGPAPEFFAGETKDAGPQSILKVKPKKQYFEASVDSEFLYTSNMFLEENGNGVDPTETSMFINTALFALAPTAYSLGPGKLAPRLGFEYQWVNYGLEKPSRNLDQFDFDSQTAFVGTTYSFGNNYVARAGLDWNRLVGHEPSYSDYNELYQEYLPNWGLYRQLPWSESKVFTLGYEGSLHITDTPNSPDSDVNNRTDHALLIAYMQALTPKFIAQPYYRFQYTRYTAVDGRDDFLHTFGFSLTYLFNDQISLRATATGDMRESDDKTVPDYRKLDAGLGLNLTFRF